jgi:hypothetical protein
LDQPYERPVRQRQPVPIWVMAAALILLAVFPVLMWQWYHRVPTEFESFWAPAFDSASPLVVAISPASESAPDASVGFGDSAAAFRLGGLLSGRSHPTRLVPASRIDPAGERTPDLVLIGANRSTAALTKGLRFRFALPDGGRPSIVDSTNEARHWPAAPATNNTGANEDYILICRLRNAGSGGFVIIGAGSNQYGTREAGRLLADQAALVPLLKQLPGDWASKNVELVLHARSTGDEPSIPELIDKYVW